MRLKNGDLVWISDDSTRSGTPVLGLLCRKGRLCTVLRFDGASLNVVLRERVVKVQVCRCRIMPPRSTLRVDALG